MALSPLPRSLPARVRARGVTAVLGPTNTGKTHLAIERLLGHESGMIGLPLRLLAREVYNRVVERAGSEAVALITGEEKIRPANARYWVATIEAMPRDIDVAFCAIDEIQLAGHFDRGHVFTDRLLNQRGRAETLVIGADTMRPLVEQLLPGVNVVSRPRLSQLSCAGEKKITRLPRRSAIVAFSVEEVYAIAELIRRQHGGAAVVLGALSPRTRNAQVELYQSGDVDYIVATDAIGMGLNLDVDHVAFASNRKFDGFGFRELNPAEIGQIAGRAGRHLKDGTFGTTGRAEAFGQEIVEAVEDHRFDPVRIAQWRNPDLDFRSIAHLRAALAATPSEPGLTRAPVAEDEAALDILARDLTVRDLTQGKSAVERLWEVCQVPDYRKVAPAAHAELVGTIYESLMRAGTIGDDWFARQIRHVDRTDGEIDTLSGRIAQVRTWTFVANRPDWLRDPAHWQGVTRQVEDRLSDALHDRLASRFVDRRTSVLMRRLRENAMLEAEVTTSGDVLVEGQHVGRLQGFQFAPDAEAGGQDVRALRAAAQKALAGEIEARADRLAGSPDETFVLSNDGVIRWNGDGVARLAEGEKLLSPALRLIADDSLAAGAREKVEARLALWLKAHVAKLLGALDLIETAEDITGLARGVAFQIAEALGVLERARVAQDVRSLDQENRASLRRHGVRFGAYHLYMPQLLKPAPRALAAQLWALKNGGLEQPGLDDIAHLAASGRTSFKLSPEVAKGLYRAAGFRVCGERVLRVDILERLADLIRPAIAYKPGVTPGEPPAGAADGDGFVVTVAMTSLAGCAGEDFASILKSLGYVAEKRTGPAITAELVPAPRLVSPPAAEEAEPDAPAQAADEEAAGEEAAVPEEAPASGETSAPEAVSAPEETAAPEEPAVQAEAAAQETPAADAGAGEEVSTPASEPSTPEAVVAEVADVPSEDVSAEAPAAPDEAVAAPEASEEAPAPEVVEIDIWRPHRHQHGPRQRQGQRPGARQGEAQGERRGRGGNEARAEQSARPSAPADGSTAEAGESPRNEDGDRSRSPRQQERQRRFERFGDAPRPRGGGQNGAAGEEGRPPARSRNAASHHGKGGGERFSGDRNGGSGAGKGWQDRKNADRAPDPDSPFAKLAALKQALEGRGKDKG
ncbi:MAG: helicase-related protein [Pseudochelatococcus sp.]|jgi:ATP-dependent RNA helicase SUPV3L1/SUV3|uniref:helicase-related protein n=1 Tax=Pseudochelatococcus sp. TaxID=2020869 RepID=UPI003D8ECB26